MEWYKCEQAFKGLKKDLGKPLLLLKPISNEVLFLYLAVSDHAKNSSLVREENNVQLLVYYIARDSLRQK